MYKLKGSIEFKDFKEYNDSLNKFYMEKECFSKFSSEKKREFIKEVIKNRDDLMGLFEEKRDEYLEKEFNKTYKEIFEEESENLIGSKEIVNMYVNWSYFKLIQDYNKLIDYLYNI